ncbi:hypothetical protein GCM10022268_29000 [Sphingomonas cynarae]|uniref:Uncharacterized protein n=1 Tax=Sphingomonas cynarae TaxID=930197 RepID=A0ABP7EGT0_9SPHN
MHQQIGRINPPAPRHTQMEDHRIAAIGVDHAVFGAATQSGDDRPLHPLTQIDGDRLAQISAARLDQRQALAVENGGQPANGGFDFGKFWHSMELGCVCPRHKRPLGRCP